MASPSIGTGWKRLASFERGLLAEFQVAQKYLQNGFRLIAHRERFCGCEPDLVFLSPLASTENIRIVEVKALGAHVFWETRVPATQLRKLSNLQQAWADLWPKTSILIEIAVVSQDGDVEILKDWL